MCGELVIIGKMVGKTPSRIITYDNNHGRWHPLIIRLALIVIAVGPSSGYHPAVQVRCKGVKFPANQTAISLAFALRLLFPPMTSLASSQVATGRGMRTLPIMTSRKLQIAPPFASCIPLHCTVCRNLQGDYFDFDDAPYAR